MLALQADGFQMASRRLKNARESGLRPYARRFSLEQPRSNYLRAFPSNFSYLESAVEYDNTRSVRSLTN